MNSTQIVRGSLIKNGVFLGGMVMRATWQDNSGPRQCDVLVIYQMGICYIDVKSFRPGQYVPINIEFTYLDQEFRGQTGFTPR